MVGRSGLMPTSQTDICKDFRNYFGTAGGQKFVPESTQIQHNVGI